jgi:hypothetical protein
LIGDNLWLWRADHVRLAEGEEPNMASFPYYHQTRIWEENKKGEKVKQIDECIAKNALEVNGNDVKMYGLFCEHTVGNQMVWKGERGSVSFFQCELPYDVDVDFAKNGHVGYYVDPNVKSHTGRAIGVYSNFQCYDVQAPLGLKVPSMGGDSQVSIETPFTVYLSSFGGINAVVKAGDETIGGAVDRQEKLKHGWVGPEKN